MEDTTTSAIKRTYVVIREETIEELEGAVSYHMAKGWAPLGGISVEPEYDGDGKIFYIQAVGKPTE